MLPLIICPKEKDLSIINNNISCPEEGCLSTFTNSSNLEMHLIKTHNKESSYLNKKSPVLYRYHCPVSTCKYYLHPLRTEENTRYFNKMKFLKQHYQKVHKTKAYDCPSEKCKKQFATERQLTQHMQECGQKFICSVCNFTYNSRLSLLSHAKKKNHLQTSHCLLRSADVTSGSPVKSCAIVTNFNNTGNHQLLFPRLTFDSSVNIAAAALSELSSKIVVKGVDKGIQTISRRRSCSGRTLKRNISLQTQTRISAQTQTTTQYSSKKSTKTNKHGKSSETQTLQDTDNAVDSEDSIFSTLNRKNIINMQNFCNFGTQTNVNSDFGSADNNLLVGLTNNLNNGNSSESTNLSDMPFSNNELNGFGGNLNNMFTSGSNLNSVDTNGNSNGIPLANARMEVDDLTLNLLDNSQQFDGGIQQSAVDYNRDNQTQTDLNFSEPVLSHNETQTLASTSDDVYSHNCTQTCQDWIDDYVEIADIETQTLWDDLCKMLVDTETQTIL